MRWSVRECNNWGLPPPLAATASEQILTCSSGLCQGSPGVVKDRCRSCTHSADGLGVHAAAGRDVCRGHLMQAALFGPGQRRDPHARAISNQLHDLLRRRRALFGSGTFRAVPGALLPAPSTLLPAALLAGAALRRSARRPLPQTSSLPSAPPASVVPASRTAPSQSTCSSTPRCFGSTQPDEGTGLSTPQRFVPGWQHPDRPFQPGQSPSAGAGAAIGTQSGSYSEMLPAPQVPASVQHGDMSP